jgi:hypothetical protein
MVSLGSRGRGISLVEPGSIPGFFPRDFQDLHLGHRCLPERLIGISVRPFRILTHYGVESRPLLAGILDEAGLHGHPESDIGGQTALGVSEGRNAADAMEDLEERIDLVDATDHPCPRFPAGPRTM